MTMTPYLVTVTSPTSTQEPPNEKERMEEDPPPKHSFAKVLMDEQLEINHN
ncbi:hypothetical protein RDI58_001534 [Solanum bulbocastanum]|uniref:Uncharacterized protein n=1 Tax=Solanum bulbocastanum TaxID=147425 RepID=A0AAN8UC13_SOLBU